MISAAWVAAESVGLAGLAVFVVVVVVVVTG